MKTIELTTIAPYLAELLALASEETVVLKTPEGREYVLGELDDFDEELALIRNNKIFGIGGERLGIRNRPS